MPGSEVLIFIHGFVVCRRSFSSSRFVVCLRSFSLSRSEVSLPAPLVLGIYPKILLHVFRLPEYEVPGGICVCTSDFGECRKVGRIMSVFVVGYLHCAIFTVG